MIKILPANAGDIRDVALIPGLGRSPGGGHGKPLQYSCLENPIYRGAWWATVHRASKNQTGLKWLSTKHALPNSRAPVINHHTVLSLLLPHGQKKQAPPEPASFTLTPRACLEVAVMQTASAGGQNFW